ncbi:hypothetical protein PCASD_02419 [Puccinia coronata f. sp. avenae]|uniref:Uncharacterized protein n=1 Tax=Puccinia coronata f. sp. avenae TaxID=200324 RepID=A0A2N5VMA7_9BASI|nr:hypothetical protein PCASD_02419 [Puccinia coronata f. sp. avenae]
MPTKAQNSQRQRRRNKKKEKALNQSRKSRKTIKTQQATGSSSKNSTNNVPNRSENAIVIDSSDSGGERSNNTIIVSDGLEDFQNHCDTNPIFIGDSNEEDAAKIMLFQEGEIKEINQANDTMNFIHASLDDNDSSDEDEPLSSLWPVFNKNQTAKSVVLPAKRQLLSGKQGYQKPLDNPNPNSKKLIPAKIPHTSTAGDSNLEPANFQTICNQDSAVELCLQNHMDKYLFAPKAVKSSNISLQAQNQWEELNSAINSVSSKLKKKSNKDKTFQYPKAIIASLNEFNYLRQEYTLNGTPSSSKTAALATAQSSIRRCSLTKANHQKPLSGIYLAQTISKHARNVLNNKSIEKTQDGN